jgi:peptidoglycan-N-acetylglucosamine deacetylase
MKLIIILKKRILTITTRSLNVLNENPWRTKPEFLDFLTMDKFFVNTSRWLHRFFPNYIWRIETSEPIVYLTFDDGPTPMVTPWVLELLKTFDAKATFFCIGSNIEEHPNIAKSILEEGHSLSNHTLHHEKGWKTSDINYVNSVLETERHINSIHSQKKNSTKKLFRPPYGRIKSSQAKALKSMGYEIVMWDVLSRDYAKSVSSEACVQNVLKHNKSGSIIVFHDSKKAFPILEKALPEILISLKNMGYRFETLN